MDSSTKSFPSDKEWFSSSELSGLPGLPKSKRGIRITAQRQGWPYKTVPVKGGRRIVYHISSLPPKYASAIRANTESSSPSPANSMPVLPPLSSIDSQSLEDAITLLSILEKATICDELDSSYSYIIQLIKEKIQSAI
jgi:Mu DNA-binding domain